MSRWILFAALLAMFPMPAIAAGLDDARAGLAAQSRGDLDAAIEFYAKAIESGELGRKHTVFALNNLGLAYDTKGKHDDAIISFNAAIQLMPDYHRAYFNRGISRASLGEYDQAIADYDRAIEIDPSDPDIVKRRADAYLARPTTTPPLRSTRMTPNWRATAPSHCRPRRPRRSPWPRPMTRSPRRGPNHPRRHPPPRNPRSKPWRRRSSKPLSSRRPRHRSRQPNRPSRRRPSPGYSPRPKCPRRHRSLRS